MPKRAATPSAGPATPAKRAAPAKRGAGPPTTPLPAASAAAPAWVEAGLAHVSSADGARLARVVAKHGPPAYLRKAREAGGACGALCRIIVGQQLAGAAATKIWSRTVGALCAGGTFDAAEVVAAAAGADEFDDATRRACGLSRAKARAIVGVARAFEAGDLSDDALEAADAADLRETLLALRGVGPWSCDMYLLFHLKKPDVLPLGDLGVRNGASKFFRVTGRGKNGSLDEKRDGAALAALFAPYAPYRSLAAYYMWRVADTKAFTQDEAAPS